MMIKFRPYLRSFPILSVLVLCWPILFFGAALADEAGAKMRLQEEAERRVFDENHPGRDLVVAKSSVGEGRARAEAEAFDPVRSVDLTGSRQVLYTIENQQIGDILVITGRARNNSAHPISFLRLRASLQNSDGRDLAERFFYAGNVLKTNELMTMSRNQIVSQLNMRDGRKGQNLNIKPGADLPFMAVFLNIPEDRAGYHVEVVSASPAGPPATDKTGAPAATSENKEGDDSAEHITFTRDQQNHYFRENQEAGNILIITGMVRNSFPDRRSFIRLRGHLLDAGGRTLADRFIYAGNIISEDDLRTLPIKEIYSRLNIKGGQDGRNLNIESGREIPFMLVFDKLPEGMSEYRVDPVGSSPAD